MLNSLLIIIGKALSIAIQTFNLGHGSTWPGHIALSVNPKFTEQILKKNNLKIVLVAGTNGKTTTSKLIHTILQMNNIPTIQNQSGANLLNGIASTLLLHANINGKIKEKYAIFEVDENAFPHILKVLTPHFILLLNLFRDQLDRYGEVDSIAIKWREAIKKVPNTTQFILNGDDPRIAFLGNEIKGHKQFFGVDDITNHAVQEHATDSTYCPRCGEKLMYNTIAYSHIGDWQCSHCGLKRPKLTISSTPLYPLSGNYNRYNTVVAVLFGKTIGLTDEQIEKGLKVFVPAFGRQEKITVNGKHIQIFLSKNPTGFNESIRTIQDIGATTILIALNDRIADGQDVSWIWDIDTEMLMSFAKQIIVSGDRAEDMGLRIKYSDKFEIRNSKFEIINNLNQAIQTGLEKTAKNETLYVLPTYTAMLEIRKILTGKQIL